MGQELKCAVRFGKQRSEGKALLETSELIFRGDFRVKIAFKDMKSVEALKGELRVQGPDGLMVFEIGEQAAKWREKILHPKSRIEKLGVKSGTRVSLLGNFTFDEAFVREVRKLTPHISLNEIPADAQCVFFATPSQKELALLAKHAKKLKGAAALWVVHPKGQKEITEMDVLGAGREADLKDVKVVGFSPTHTARKFVLPLSAR